MVFLLVNMLGNASGTVSWCTLNISIHTENLNNLGIGRMLCLRNRGAVCSSCFELLITLIALFGRRVIWFSIVVLAEPHEIIPFVR